MTLYAADTGQVSLASRNDVPVGVRWTTLRYVTFRRAMRFCAGPTRRREWRDWEDSIRPLFARSPSETRFFAWVADPPSALACVRVFYSPPWSDSKPSKP